MRILLTNDDGIDAPGFRALIEAVTRLDDVELIVVAPASEQSQCGHRVTTATPLRVERRNDRIYAVDGTPADCVRVGLFGLACEPDWVFSGINQGGNLGQDIVISGTVAAVREAAYHGVKGMAFSHYVKRGKEVDWDRAARWVAALIGKHLESNLGRGEFWNFNLPHLPGEMAELPQSVRSQPAASPLLVDFARSAESPDSQITEFLYTGSYADRPRDPGSDVEACFGGQVSVSKLSV